MDDYTVKFEELSIFCPHYNGLEAKGSKRVKFECGLRPKIKQSISYQEIGRFPMLMNKCRIYNEDNKVRFAHYNCASENKSEN